MDTDSSIVAVPWAPSADLANISFPALLAEAFTLKAITMARAVGHHLAAFGSAIGTGPSLVAFASQVVALAVVRAVVGAERL